MTLSLSFVQTADGRIAFREEGSGPPLLLLHSLGSSRHAWSGILPLLSSSHRVIAADVLGHGDSDQPRRPFAIADHAACLFEGLDLLGLNQVTVVGNSLGAVVGLEMAASRPERVERLVLIGCPGPRGTAEKGARLAAVRSQLDARGIPGALTDEEARSSYHHVTPEILEQVNADRRKAGSWYLATSQALMAYDVETRFGAVHCPVLLLWGAHDRGQDKAPSFLAGITGARMAIVPDAGHVAQVAQPVAVAGLIRQFLAEP